MDTTIGFLHPGAMGSVMASCCVAANRLWVRHGRSTATQARAAAAGLEPVEALAEMTARAQVIVSICPPAASTEVAQAVRDTGFGGIFIDANAISPDRSRSNARLFENYVDASVIGPPPTQAGLSRLYVSGRSELAAVVAQLWDGSDLDVRNIGPEVGAASALKMAYAGWTKGSAALLTAIAALADAEGVAEPLHAEWKLSQPDLPTRLEIGATRSAPKAWRFSGEMEEIADSMANVGLPSGFHDGAAQIYQRLVDLKDAEPDLATVLAQLLGRKSGFDDGGDTELGEAVE